jgi:Fe-Mn family superoxide dismutase
MIYDFFVKEEDMTYAVKDYSKLIGMPGFSDTLLNNHLTLYKGYVDNTNKLMDKLGVMLKGGTLDSPEYAEIKRRLGFEFNGMRLHEYYFENLGGHNTMSQPGGLATRLTADFGSYEAWEKDFRATGAIRGVGWVILYQDGATGQLINLWINEHQVNHWAGCQPILVMDVWEHAYMLDYGIKRAGYIDAFFKNIDWLAAEARLK